MIRLSTTGEATAAVRGARSVDLLAYTLQRGPLLDALESAALHGAKVRVRLEGAPFGASARGFARYNGGIVRELRHCGAEAHLARATAAARKQPPVHAKALVADGTLFLDDRNWGESDFVVTDSDPNAAQEVAAALGGGMPHDASGAAFALSKSGALKLEAELLRHARNGDHVIVESESFGAGNAVYVALDDLAREGCKPRLIVSAREARNVPERGALARLVRDGADVRVTCATEKFALAGAHAWIGSANASLAFGKFDMLDWGACTNDAATVAAARARVEARWSSAKTFRPKDAGDTTRPVVRLR